MQPETSAPHERGDGRRDAQPPREPFDQQRLERELRERVGDVDYEHWFGENASFGIDGDELVVGVPSPFLVNWMQTRFREGVSAVAQAVLGPAGRVRFEVDASLSATTVARVEEGVVRRKEPRRGPTGTRPVSRGRRFRDLADLVEGDCNGLALTAARRVCDAPGNGCNPLYVFGGVGTGKTHVLEGIHRKLRREFPNLNVTYVTAEGFGNQFVESLRDHSVPAFRTRFRSVDVLLVDDVDFFDGKRVIQEEFLNTVKHLERAGGQLVCCGARHPRLAKRISGELSTRLVSGIIARMESPDVTTAMRIVDRKATRTGLRASREALEHVAKRFRRNVREIEGALAVLETWNTMTDRSASLGDARRLLTELERDCIRVVRMSDIERVVCEFFGVEPQELKSPKRHRGISQPRMLAMYLARRLTGASYSEIGRHFGRNHTTVLSAERKVNDWIKDRKAVTISSENWTMDDVLTMLEREIAG